MPLETFCARMDDFIAEIKTSKVRPGFSEILVPGRVDFRREQAYLASGAQLDSVIFDELAALATELGIAFPFAREVVE
ncbi:MAG UNVERIFIED_CONTAM: hypothetical protein LVT10_06580 [Anaerolineae bacterium]|jgi:LDH2 family malate/lactate/ureidoglycolate dehydrogenase